MGSGKKFPNTQSKIVRLSISTSLDGTEAEVQNLKSKMFYGFYIFL